MESILIISACTMGFCLLDQIITPMKIQGVYYIIHAIHNAIIVGITYPDIVHAITDLHNVRDYPTNYFAIYLCYSLHLYHIAIYWHKFRKDDWLHHGLMLGVCLPIGCMVDGHCLTGMALCMTTGFSGGVDYILLTLVRNGMLHKKIEKRINAFMNVWIRSPGCVATATLITAHVLSIPDISQIQIIFALLPAILVYWNGQYFMEQVVTDYVALAVSSHRSPFDIII